MAIFTNSYGFGGNFLTHLERMLDVSSEAYIAVGYTSANTVDRITPKAERICRSGESIIISSHACGELSRKIIKIYNDNPSCKHLIMLPCCAGKFTHSLPEILSKKVDKYMLWCHDLWLSAHGRSIISDDKKCLSPCNIVITASKETK